MEIYGPGYIFAGTTFVDEYFLKSTCIKGLPTDLGEFQPVGRLHAFGLDVQ